MSYHHERVKVLLSTIRRYNSNHKEVYYDATVAEHNRTMGNATSYEKHYTFLFSKQILEQWDALLAGIDTISDDEIVQIEQYATDLFRDMGLDKVPDVVKALDALTTTASSTEDWVSTAPFNDKLSYALWYAIEYIPQEFLQAFGGIESLIQGLTMLTAMLLAGSLLGITEVVIGILLSWGLATSRPRMTQGIQDLAAAFSNIQNAKTEKQLQEAGRAGAAALGKLSTNVMYVLLSIAGIKRMTTTQGSLQTKVQSWMNERGKNAAKQLQRLVGEFLDNVTPSNVQDIINHKIIGMKFEEAYKEQGNPDFEGSEGLNGYVLYYETRKNKQVPIIRRRSGNIDKGYIPLTVIGDFIIPSIGFGRIADSGKLGRNMINKPVSVETIKMNNDERTVTLYFQKTNEKVKLYKVDKVKYEAHHLIPDQVYQQNDFFKKVRSLQVSYNIDRKSNGIFLPREEKDATEHKEWTQGLDGYQDLPSHQGSHPEFSAEIGSFAAKMTATVNHDNASDLIEEVENEARRIIFEKGKKQGERLSVSQHDEQRYG